jgi:hypothetical protein
MACCCEQCVVPSGYINGGKFLRQLSVPMGSQEGCCAGDDDDDHHNHDHVDKVRLCLRTAATNGPIVHPHVEI